VFFAPFQTLCTTLNSVVSIASKSVYGQQWGQKRLGMEQPQKSREKGRTNARDLGRFQKLSHQSKKKCC